MYAIRSYYELTKLPGITRIRGGAIHSETRVSLTYSQRNEFDPIKEALVTHALSLFNENDIIFLDAGTTSTALARQLDIPAQIITNSIEVLQEISEKANIRKCILGGMFDDFSHAILGNVTLEQIKHYRADKAIIGVSALSESGITANTELDALIKKSMAEQSGVVICITTHAKFNTQLMYQSCDWTSIDYLITDQYSYNFV